MNYLKILSLVTILAFSSAVLAQEKETEKPKEKPKELSPPDSFQRATEPHSIIFSGPWINRNQRKTQILPVLNQPADVTGLELVFKNNFDDETDIYLCLPDKGLQIEINTKAKDKENDVLIYHYVVSVGEIIGKGENVIWDLSDVKPGAYTITAAVDDGCGFCGRTVTRTITVK